MSITLLELAEQLGVDLLGDGDTLISAVSTLQHGSEGELGFLANSSYRKYLAETKLSAVILSENDAGDSPVAVLVSTNPYADYARAVQLLYPPKPVIAGVHESAIIQAGAEVDPGASIGPNVVIAADARIGKRVQLGPGCVIDEGVSIGDDSYLVANVTVLAKARIGCRVTIQPGAVIGSEGFGIAAIDNGWLKVPQLGSVQIGNDVDIGANTTIDRGALEDTVIEEGVRIDNQVQVAHNVFIGAHTAIAGCVGISGSARIGRHCRLAGGVGIVGHLEIADHVTVTGMSMVTRSITREGTTWSAGTPLMQNAEWRRNAVRMKQLENLSKRLSGLEKKIK
ncbi:UDP-3-O-[3-hydroxymyristoyl] glucosamine N-acyltransferase [Thiogranum longum]|uniref:UDP-3-O-acylglucosamine N-acyltransferase n=1 Tax=Thiogranum longum TaxID=1537524 RepID=A0A4R1H996_9GAMM|nr:UDP-3-O-(3-hydroxymyristoyl)glucosamine N-acyltransferase [Thiogranum longum]TCK18447.1 UDP-3-O-[3-hydroxymyristoyl] glucosamine N-acyltransferase [Thiogranum longum]